jgi:hypothetical protein
MQRLEFLPTRERFLPFRPLAALERLRLDPRLSDAEREQFTTLYEMISTRHHFDFHRLTERLQRLYEPLDPDRDVLLGPQAAHETRELRLTEMGTAFRKLLADGNYVELPRRRIVECVELQNYGGLKVEANLDEYQDLAIFYRGVQHEQRCTRPWRNFWRKRNRACTLLRRAAVLVRTAEDPDHLHFKLFKNIVAEDLEMVLPRVRVRMHWLDGLKIGGSLAGSLGTACWKAFTAVLLSPWLFLFVFGTFLFAMLRALLAYLGSKTRYLQVLSANLYFQNMANNSGALCYLVDSAEAEETKELLLAYAMLYFERDRDCSADELGRRVAGWVREQFGLDIDFDGPATVRKLVAKGLAAECERADRQPPLADADPADPAAVPRRVVRACDLPTALGRLKQAWDEFAPYHGQPPAEEPRPAEVARPPVESPASPHWQARSKKRIGPG